MSNVMNETTKLKSSSDTEPTYAKLSGPGHQKSLSLNKAEEYITFDFMVTLNEEQLTTNDNLKTAITQSVDCEAEQIEQLKITQIDDGSRTKQCRVNGKIYTDDWELPILQKKFEKIISDRVLSGNLQTICSLEDRPMIRRFFCKTSRQTKSKSSGANLGALKTTDSLRTLKDDAFKSFEPTITPTTKAKGKANESVSISASENKDKDREDAERNDKGMEDKELSASPSVTSPLKSEEGNNSSSSSSSTSKASKTSEGDRRKHMTQPRPSSDDQCECFCVVL